MATTKIPVAMRLDPEVKEIATRRAREERRSLAGYVEWLVVEDDRRRGEKASRPGRERKAPQ